VLSDRPRLLYDYFQQLFAQVTNPPLDAIREELVTSMGSTIGPEGNLLKPVAGSCRQIKIASAILDNEQLAKLRHIDEHGFRSISIPMLFEARSGGLGLARALEDLQARTSKAVAEGYTIIILLGPRRELQPGADSQSAGRGQHSSPSGARRHAEPRGVRHRERRCARGPHLALLIGYGAGAVNPYLAFETLDDMARQGVLPGVTAEKAVKNYMKALNKGVLKVMSKMGISTLQSYRGAQIFEAIGLDKEFVDRYFTHTSSRIGGAGIDAIAAEVRARHEQAFPSRPVAEPDLDEGGEYQWRRDGEFHLFNPDTVYKLQHATRSGQYKIYKEYTQAVNEQTKKRATLRGLFELKLAETPVPLDEVEPVESILKRFATGAMSYGSISKEAHETLAIAMNRIGGKSNTGEGGRRSRALRTGRQWRFAQERHQAGGLRALRRDERISGERGRSADQDGAGCQARRRRPAAGTQGLSLDCQGAARHPRRRPDFSATASRHLFDRGSRAAHLRLEERQLPRAHPREAGGGSGRGHGGGGRGESALGRRADFRP
jgi:glutamate synthase (ferredoxin)